MKATVPYAEAIGCLRYITTVARPDIAYPVGVASRFQSNPSPAHWSLFKRIFRYLRGTLDYALVLGGGSDLTLDAFVDADFLCLC
jgi:hypothetical protein